MAKYSASIDFKELKFLYGLGFALIWLRGKVPVHSRWTKGPRHTWQHLIATYKPGYNVGVRLGSASKLTIGGFLAIWDFDIKSTDPRHLEEATNALKKLCPEAMVAPKVLSGRGNSSAHYHVRVSEPVRGKLMARSAEVVAVSMPSVSPSRLEYQELSIDQLSEGLRLRPAWEIGLLGDGQQAVLPGSKHPDSGNLYKWATGRKLEL